MVSVHDRIVVGAALAAARINHRANTGGGKPRPYVF